MYFTFDDLTEKKKSYDKIFPLPEELTAILDEWFRIQVIHTSNALEGNTLNYGETDLVINIGRTFRQIFSEREIQQAKNHAKAWSWVKEQVQRDPTSITEKDILLLHSMMLDKIDIENAGKYRSTDIKNEDLNIKLPFPEEVPGHMDYFLDWLRKGRQDLHPVEYAAHAHYCIVLIQPFYEGSGPVARLLMNWILMMQGYPPAAIRIEDHKRYIYSLKKSQVLNDLRGFLDIMIKSVECSLYIYIEGSVSWKKKKAKGETQDSSIFLYGS